MNSQSRIRVAVVFGGRSSEHAISCATAGSVLDALQNSPDADRYEVVPIGIAADGRWSWPTRAPRTALWRSPAGSCRRSARRAPASAPTW
jgi:D-alanine-D-alanine ligase